MLFAVCQINLKTDAAIEIWFDSTRFSIDFLVCSRGTLPLDQAGKKEKKNSCPRHCRLSALWWSLIDAPPQTPRTHHNNIVSRGLKEALN